MKQCLCPQKVICHFGLHSCETIGEPASHPENTADVFIIKTYD